MDALKIVGALVLGGSIAVAAQTVNGQLAQLRSSLAANPNDPELHFRVGDALEKSGDLSGAESEYKKSLALQAKNPSALGALAYLYSTQKRFAEAEGALRSFIAVQPQDAKAHVQLGSVLFYTGNKDEAIKELTAALGLAPSDSGV